MKASQAISVLCSKLSAKEQATRSYAVEALVAIGDKSIPALENVLKSSSGRARAAAATALNRLGQFDLEEYIELGNWLDSDIVFWIIRVLFESINLED